MESMTDKLRLVYGDHTLGVHGAGFSYIFSYSIGGLESLRAGGREWVYRAPKPTFWRATTDNDRGNKFPLRSGAWLSADMFIRVTGADVCVDGRAIERPIAPVNNRYGRDEFADSVSITFHYEPLIAPAPQVDVAYSVEPCGRITVRAAYHGRKGLPQLPVFGWRMIMPTMAEGFRYEGLSGETYPDRRMGAERGAFEVKGLPVTPYLVPQECGMHMDTSWLEIERATSLDNAAKHTAPSALRFSALNKGFAFSCLPYTAEELENATHHEELPPARRTVLCICGAVRGVGGIDSWGADVEEEYQLSGEADYAFSFMIDPKVS